MVGKRMAAAAAITWTALAAPAHAQAGGVNVSVAAERPLLGKNDAVAVTVTISNTTDATAWLLKWQTPFDAVEAPLFEVTRDGLPVAYLGRQVKRAAPAPSDYLALPPGSSRSVRVELSALYAMSATGAYSIRYRAGALQLFGKPDAQAALAPGLAQTAAPAATVWIAGSLPRGALDTVPAPEGGPGLAFSQCSAPQQQALTGAVQAAQAMAADGDAWLRLSTPAPGPRYGTWFGAFDATRMATVARHFAAIKEAFASKPVTVDCGCTESYFAYVYPNQPYKIYVCNAFWAAPLTGTDSRGGTLVHEMSHFTVVAGTDDWAYGQAAAAALATSNPARAVDNADSHEYFGENTPRLELR